MSNNRVLLASINGAPVHFPPQVTSPPPDGQPVQWIYLTPRPGITERQVYCVNNARTTPDVSFQITTDPAGTNLLKFTGPQPNFTPLPAAKWWTPGNNRSCLVFNDNSVAGPST